jgi:hypothetical protein
LRINCQEPDLENLERKHLFGFRHLAAANGKAGFLRAAIPFAFSPDVPALRSKLTTMRNGPVGSIK